jgi:hypothetical protein
MGPVVASVCLDSTILRQLTNKRAVMREIIQRRLARERPPTPRKWLLSEQTPLGGC